ncbi:hypothetical protein ABT282_07145 [Streptomyces sp. NPDC000927]|uniref:hypothetical protein n=1 Tax=Streptomyces sp. NPDC000927 TaxID=3154371 RepID=UPI0033184C76
MEDLTDPDHHEIAQEVQARYAQENESRRIRGLRRENDALRSLLTENGIDIPEHG